MRMLPGSPLYGCSTIGLAHSCNLAFTQGCRFADVARQPPYGCGAIGLAHSSNLFSSRRNLFSSCSASLRFPTQAQDRPEQQRSRAAAPNTTAVLHQHHKPAALTQMPHASFHLLRSLPWWLAWHFRRSFSYSYLHRRFTHVQIASFRQFLALGQSTPKKLVTARK